MHQPLELVCIDVVVGDVEQVPGRAGHDPVGADRSSELEHDDLERVGRPLQVALGPQILDQPLRGGDHAGPQREQGQQRALAEPGERDLLTLVVADVQRSEQPDSHGQTLAASHVW